MTFSDPELGLCGTRPVPTGKGRAGYVLHGYESGTGMELWVRVRAGIPALLAKILVFLPHVVYLDPLN